MVGSNLIDFPVLSLHIGGEIARTTRAIIDPDNLKIIAYVVDGAIIHNDNEIGNILDMNSLLCSNAVFISCPENEKLR